MGKYKYTNIEDALHSLKVRSQMIQDYYNWKHLNKDNRSLLCSIADIRSILDRIEEEIK